MQMSYKLSWKFETEIFLVANSVSVASKVASRNDICRPLDSLRDSY
jgi:hypothetical protein